MKKPFIRLAIFFMAIATICMSGSCIAVSGETSEKNADTVLYGNTSDNTYYEYADKFAESPLGQQALTVAGGDYASETGSGAVKKSVYEGKSNVLLWDTEKGTVSYAFNLSDAGLYNIIVTYRQVEKRGSDIRLSLKIDNEILFDGMEEITLPRLWKNKGEVRVDGNGDQFAPEQIEAPQWTAVAISDKDGVTTSPYEFMLSSGTHTITFELLQEALCIESISLTTPKRPLNYEEAKNNYPDAKNYSGKPIVIQGEDASVKTTNSLIPKSDNSNANLNPIDSKNLLINIIGGSSWSKPGEKLTWEFTVPESAYYSLGIKFNQSYLINGVSYRTLKIDGEIPFEEAKSLAFEYKTSWQNMTFGEEKPYLIYLEKGPHELSLEVTMAKFAEYYTRLEKVVSLLGDEYIKINMITGENPDANRNYDLFKQIPNFNETLNSAKNDLDKLASDMKKDFGERSSSLIAAINGMSQTLSQMIENPYTSHRYKSSYYTNYQSVSAWLYDMKSMPLAIDEMYISAPDYKADNAKPGFLKAFNFSVRKFIYSFAQSYYTESNSKTDSDKQEIKIWVNWGRDQAQILDTLIRESFTAKTGIPVRLEAVNTTVINGILSGNPPDLMLHMARTAPVNYAMRGVLKDLTEFEDFDEVMKRFQSSSATPYEYNGGCYALPDTQAFYIMFYREDILSQLGIDVPKTWDEFLEATTAIQRKKMQVWLPYMNITSATTVDTGIGGLSIFPSLMNQSGLSLYNAEKNGCNLNNYEAISVFEKWTSFYTDYKIPKEASFYNRFRLGTMPLGIETYTTYQTLMSAAPEIQDRWHIAPIPGIMNEDGTINNSCSGSGTGAGVLKGTGRENEAWEFIKWWTSAETQLSYSNNLESILGSVGRVASANIEAVSNMSWKPDDLKIILEQWKQVKEIEEIPGSYYLTRSLDQAFWSVINGSSTAKEAITEWSRITDNEIKRKIAEYEE